MRLWRAKELLLAKVMRLSSAIVTSLVKSLWRLKTVPLLDPAILFLAIYPKEMKLTFRDTSTLFMALFTVAKMSNLGAVQWMTGLYNPVRKHT